MITFEEYVRQPETVAALAAYAAECQKLADDGTPESGYPDANDFLSQRGASYPGGRLTYQFQPPKEVEGLVAHEDWWEQPCPGSDVSQRCYFTNNGHSVCYPPC
jgi:hypothetical protein